MIIHTQELYHTGVKGMRWGHKKAVALNSKIANERKSGINDIKEWQEIGKNKGKDVSKQIARSQNITDKNIAKSKMKLDKIQGHMDKQANVATQRNIARLSDGQARVQRLLLGDYGALVYNSSKLTQTSQGKKIGTALLSQYGNTITLGNLSKHQQW